MSVLSIVAVGRLAERRVRQAGTPLPVEDVVSWLVGAVGVQDDRARAGVRLAVTVCRLEITTAADGRPCLQLPDSSGDGPVSLVSEAAATPATSRREGLLENTPGGFCDA